MSRRAVLVTGASGFLGSRIARELLRQGCAVHALRRPGSNVAELEHQPIVWHEGDVRDEPSLERALAATSAASGEAPRVVHAAAVISYRTRDRALQWEVNVQGTRNLLAACRRRPPARILHVSSVVTVGYAQHPGLLNEDAPFNGRELRCDYVDTKRAAEELALEAAAELDLVCANPGAIFGSSSRPSNTQRLIQRIARGRTPPFAPPGEQSVVGLDDCASGCLLALERGARGRRYILAESVVRHFDLLRRIAAATSARPPRFVLPLPLWRLIASTSALTDRVIPSDFLTPQTLRLAGVRMSFDGTRARTELGWSPSPFDQVLSSTIESMRAQGSL